MLCLVSMNVAQFRVEMRERCGIYIKDIMMHSMLLQSSYKHAGIQRIYQNTMTYAIFLKARGG